MTRSRRVRPSSWHASRTRRCWSRSRPSPLSAEKGLPLPLGEGWGEGDARVGRSPRRGVTVGAQGMVSAGHSLAAATALHVLQQGGNAVDAGLAASAVQCVVELPWCGLGGDAFWLISTPSDGVVAFNGSGVAPVGMHAGLIGG